MKNILLLVMFIFCSLPCFATSNIIIENCNAKELQNILIKRAIKYDNQVENITDNSFTIKMPLGLFGQIMYSPSGMGNSAKARADFVLLQDNKNVILSVTGNIISNDISFTRYSYPIGFKYENEILEKIKKGVEGYYTYNFNYEKKSKYIMVLNKKDYEKDTPLLEKDKIIEINDNYFNDMIYLLPDSKEKKEIIKVKIIRKNWNTKKKEIIERTIKPYYIKPYEELL